MNLKCRTSVRHDCLRILNGRVHNLNALRQTELVVLGGTGFVGSWIAEMVAALNDEFQFSVKLSLLSRNVDKFATKLPHLANCTNVHLIKSDVRQLSQFPMNADWVIHAAANPDVRTHASNPLETASVIVDGTRSVIGTVERMGQLKKLLYLSSGLVCRSQSANDHDGVTENASGAPALDASFMYPNAKRFAETLCSAARAQSRIPLVIARPFSFIGPYQSLDTPWAQTTFLADALRGRAIRVLGDGQVMRSYLYGSDTAYWLLKILTQENNSGDVVNVGSPEGMTLQDLAKAIARNFEPSPDILFNTAPRIAGKSTHLLPDITHAQLEYGLSVLTPLSDAIRSTVKWHRMIQTT